MKLKSKLFFLILKFIHFKNLLRVMGVIEGLFDDLYSEAKKQQTGLDIMSANYQSTKKHQEETN